MIKKQAFAFGDEEELLTCGFAFGEDKMIKKQAFAFGDEKEINCDL